MSTPVRSLAVGAAVAVVACTPAAPRMLPGRTDIVVTSVEIRPRAGAPPLEADYRPLPPVLSVRTTGAVRTFNPFRIVEDRQRVKQFLTNHGFFEGEVDEPELAFTPDRTRVAVTWRVHEGPRYRVGSVDVVGAPAEYGAALAALVPFRAGDRIDLYKYRPARHAIAGRLRAEGYARAQSYSRTFIRRDTKTVAWFFYVEPGPRTRVGAITVEGNRRVPAEAIVARSGLRRGAGYSPEAKLRAELALLDSGAFAMANVISEADDPGPPKFPDTGGELAPEQVDARGGFVPRLLGADLAVRIAVVEAPARQLRAEVGAEADPSRVDAYAGARLVLRDLLAPLHHVVVEGSAGYGWFVDERDPVKGLYGRALVQYAHPVGRAELRWSARWRDTLYPSALLRELSAGPGVRATLAPGLFVEGEARLRYGQTRGLPMLEPASAEALELPAEDVSRGAELIAAVIADRRNDRVEPTAGWLASARASYAPGGPLGDHRWLQLAGEVRRFVPLAASWSLAGRAKVGAVVLGDAGGVPLGPRLFGGGVDGMRGFGRDRLAPRACAAAGACDVIAGGRSLVEASAEVRWLPAREFYGGAVFVDAGAAGARLDPFASGMSAAAGVGLRARTWYLPISLDLAYRVVDENEVGAAWGRVLAFVHVGEAF